MLKSKQYPHPSYAKETKDGNQVQKKPIWKKWWFWVIVVLVIGGVASAGGGDKGTEGSIQQAETNTGDNANKENLGNKEETATVSQEGTEKSQSVETKVEVDDEKENVSKEFQAALKSAQSYSDMMHMSKMGLYQQLISEYGEKFPEDAAQYAIDNVKADWNENALAKAKEYQETMSMSNDAIYEQLISEYGEQFTKEEAQYAIDNLE